MIHTEIVEHVDKNWWNSLVRLGNGEFYQSTYHADYCEDCFFKHTYYVIAAENGTPLGIALFFLEGYGQDTLAANFPPIISKFPIRFFQSFWKCCSLIYGPLIFDLEREEAILDHLLQEIERFAKKNKIFFWKKVMPPIHKHQFKEEVWDRCFLRYGFSKDRWATFLVDLTGADEVLWQGFKSSARKAINKVKKQGVSFVRVADEKSFDQYYALLKETSQRLSFRMWFRYELLKKWWLKNQEVLQFFLVEHEGIPLAGQGVFLFHHLMREIFVGTSNYALEHKLYGSDFLKFEIFKWGKEQGYTLYDLAGVHPNPSATAEKHIRQFKEKWGGRYLEHPVYSKIYGVKRSHFLQRMKQVYARLQ